MRAHDVRERGAGATELLEREAVPEVARGGAAVLLGEGKPEEAELAHLPEHLRWDLVALLDLPLKRPQARLDEIAHGAREQPQLLGDFEIHVPSPFRRERYD